MKEELRRRGWVCRPFPVCGHNKDFYYKGDYCLTYTDVNEWVLTWDRFVGKNIVRSKVTFSTRLRRPDKVTAALLDKLDRWLATEPAWQGKDEVIFTRNE